PAETIRNIIGGNIGFFESATERLSPFSTSALTPLMLASTTELPEAPPTMSSTSRIGTPLRISCANVREKRDIQILWIRGPKTGSFSFQRSQIALPRADRRKVRTPKIVPPIITIRKYHSFRIKL